MKYIFMLDPATYTSLFLGQRQFEIFLRIYTIVYSLSSGTQILNNVIDVDMIERNT